MYENEDIVELIFNEASKEFVKKMTKKALKSADIAVKDRAVAIRDAVKEKLGSEARRKALAKAKSLQVAKAAGTYSKGVTMPAYDKQLAYLNKPSIESKASKIEAIRKQRAQNLLKQQGIGQ